jgi:WD40 repeat protein
MQMIQACCMDLKGSTIMFATNSVHLIHVYHNDTVNRSVKNLWALNYHTAQITCLDMADDGLLGVSGSLDKTFVFWNLQSGRPLKRVQVEGYLKTVVISPLGKFTAATMSQGATMLYEVFTGITWRTETSVKGDHSGINLLANHFSIEAAKEGKEHQIYDYLTVRESSRQQA